MKKQDAHLPIKNLKRKSETVANLLKILSHPQRLIILCSVANGEKTVGELERECGASQSAVSQFLKSMRLEGLIESRRKGQFIYYEIADPQVLELMKALYKIFCS
jgi:DNA-binding transcriptional ArsR family regulator